MSLTLDENKAHYVIKAYEAGQVKINDQIYQNSLILNAHKLIAWRPNSFAELSKSDLDLILPFEPDILILTTGQKLTFQDITLYGHLLNQGIGVEIMNSSSGAKTFNALTSENRNVAIAFIIK